MGKKQEAATFTMPRDLTEIKRRLKNGKPTQRDWMYLAMSLHVIDPKSPLLPKIVKVLVRDMKKARAEYYPKGKSDEARGTSFLDDEMYDLYEKTLRVLDRDNELLQEVGD